MYVKPITRQSHDYATPIHSDNCCGNIVELDPDTDDQDFYIQSSRTYKMKDSSYVYPYSHKNYDTFKHIYSQNCWYIV